MPFSKPTQNDNADYSLPDTGQHTTSRLAVFGPSSPKKEVSSLTIGAGSLSGGGVLAENEVGFLDVRGNAGTDTIGIKEKAVATFNGIAGTITTTPAVAEVTSLSITGTQAGSDATALPGAIERTDVSFSGTCADTGDYSFSSSNFSSSSRAITGAATDGDLIALTGGGGGLWYATNGRDSWQQASTGDAGVNYLAFGNGTWVASGISGKVLSTTSTPPTDLTTRSSGISGLVQPDYANNIFVLSGDGGDISTSPDGITWTARASGVTTNLKACAYANNRYISVGSGTNGSTSTNGTSWSSITTPGSHNSIAGSSSLFVAVGDSGDIQTTTDGTTWTSRTSGTTSKINDIVFKNGVFRAVADEDILTSSDGINWDLTSFTITNGDVRHIVESDDTVLVASINNTINWSEIPSIGDSVSVTLDASHSTIPITYASTALATGATQDSDLKTALDAAVTAGTLTGVTITAETDATRIVSTATGARTDLTVVITGGTGSTAASTVNVTTQGSDTVVAKRTAYTMTSSSPHSPTTVSSTFANDLSAANCLTQIRNHFVGNQIGGYSVGAISGTSFSATSDTTGNEVDLDFTITEAGTGGDLSESATVTTQGAAEIITGKPTTWTIVAEGNTYTGNFESGRNIGTDISDITFTPVGFTSSTSGGVLTLESTTTGDKTDYTVSINTDGTSATATAPSVVNTNGTASMTTQDSMQISFTGGALMTVAGIQSGSSASDIANLIVSQGYSGITLVRDDTFDVGNNALTSGDSRVKFTYDNASTQTDVTTSNFPVTDGNTSGTLAIPQVVITTQGVNAAGVPGVITISGGGLTETITFTTTSSVDKAAFVTAIKALIDANSGVYTYSGSNDIDFASEANENYTDVAIALVTGTNTMSLAASTVQQGHS